MQKKLLVKNKACKISKKGFQMPYQRLSAAKTNPILSIAARDERDIE